MYVRMCVYQHFDGFTIITFIKSSHIDYLEGVDQNDKIIFPVSLSISSKRNEGLKGKSCKY